MIYSRILGVGMYVPPRVWTNDDLKSIMETSDDWVQQRTGIKQRHWVEGTTTTSDLALEAAKKALLAAAIRVPMLTVRNLRATLSG